jgi:hypothetical protein
MTDRADSPAAKRAAPFGHRPRIRAGAVIAIALVAGFVVWLVVRDGGSSSPAPAPRAGAVPVSLVGLKTLARAVGRPIYWAGPMRGFTYELTKTSDDRVFIRYLPSGVAVGTDKPYLTIGTYPIQNAFGATKKVSRQDDSVRIPIGNGDIAFYTQNSPTNVYFAYRGSDYQVEVYSPSASQAQQLVASGRVRPVPPGRAGTPGSSGAARVSPSQLTALAASLEHAVYWAGPEPEVAYELTRTSGGSVYVRYLPRGVRIGTKKPYLTIGTYPVANAFSVTGALSRKPGAVRIAIENGVAFYDDARPTNVYFAYRGADLQVEVYDPSAARAQDLVASNRIVPVG